MMGIPTAAMGVMEIVRGPTMSAVTQFSSVQRRATMAMQLMTSNGCSALCQREGSCGDGIIQPLFEVCDDGLPMPVAPVTLIAPVSVPGQSAAMVRLVRN